MKQTFINAIIVVVAIIFSLVGYNICSEAFNKRTTELETKIFNLEKEIYCIKENQLKNDTIVLKIEEIKQSNKVKK